MSHDEFELLCVRHGPAGDSEAWEREGKPDAERPLTESGRWKMARVARGLRVAARTVDLVATSPLLRATQTASILSRKIGNDTIELVEELRPDQPPQAFVKWLRDRQKAGEARRIAIVGHEPSLGTLVSWLTCRRREPLLQLRKGGACLLSFDATQRPGAGAAELVWSLPPGLLVRLGD